MYSTTTNNVAVTVEPKFLDDQSAPDEGRFIWSYHIRIHNQGAAPVRLRARYWKITDANGVIHEVRGEGVVGEQPLLAPGESFEYTSGAPLPTPGGIMVGAYEMEAQDGRPFLVDIPAFSLDSPFQSSVIH